MFPIRDHNPSRQTPYVTLLLIAANSAVFLVTLSYGDDFWRLSQFYARYALVPGQVSAGSNWQTLLSSAFIHAGFLHLGGNMLFLWVFGDNMEEEMGHLGFLAFYLAAAAAAGLAQVLSDASSMVPMVGASGAVAGVMGGYLLLFPRARVDVLFIIIIFFRVFAIPAWIVLGVWFGLQLFNGANAQTGGGGVAYWAHIGGFAAGVILTMPVFLSHGGRAFWARSAGQPPHPETRLGLRRSSVPTVRRRRK